jgi:RimJ/RimL family protein N-acetyltransferase
VIIRQLNESDWEMFRFIRLKALQAYADVFASPYAKEAAESESWWKETLDGKGKAVFGIFDGESMIGFTGIFTARIDPTGQTGILAMSYIEPEYRGQGLSRLFYRARIDWAITQPQLKMLTVSHREGNETSRRANQAFGFILDHKEKKLWPDGTEADDWYYSLDLESLRKKPDPDMLLFNNL